MSDDTKPSTGGCYCGAVRYRARGLSREVTECHCSQCRKQSGHRYATAQAKSVEIEGGDNVTWFRASTSAERGFCSTCGSHLFWRPASGDHVSVLAASIDEPTGLQLARHIFVTDRGDYYDISDGLPQLEGYDKPHPAA